MVLKIVFFDMGGTIETYRYDREWRIQHAYLIRDCLTKGGIKLDLTDEQLADTITRGIKAYHVWNMASRHEIPPVQIWKNYILKDFPIAEENLAHIAEELALIYETQFYDRRMRPEIPDVLEKIKALGLKIGCISNVQSRGQVPKNLKDYGIIDYFSTIVLSSAYGRRKPDPAIFHHAARLANYPTSACVYVGDKINRDILGARQAGFRLAVQIRHIYDDGESDEGAVPDAVINRMNELLPLLEHELEKDRKMAEVLAARPIKAFFFDAGDILYQRPEPDAHFRIFLANHPATPQKHFKEKSKALKELAFIGALDRRQYHTRLLSMHGIDDPALVEEGIAALEQDELVVEIMPGVPATLQTLKKHGFLLGIITDTALPNYVKLDWFRRAGFGDVWDSFISSRESGVRKPAASIYQLGLDQMGIPANQCVFVGHRDYELEGARAMGMVTVAFNHDADAKADFFIRDFADLLKCPFVAQFEL